MVPVYLFGEACSDSSHIELSTSVPDSHSALYATTLLSCTDEHFLEAHSIPAPMANSGEPGHNQIVLASMSSQSSREDGQGTKSTQKD